MSKIFVVCVVHDSNQRVKTSNSFKAAITHALERLGKADIALKDKQRAAIGLGMRLAPPAI